MEKLLNEAGPGMWQLEPSRRVQDQADTAQNRAFLRKVLGWETQGRTEDGSRRSNGGGNVLAERGGIKVNITMITR